MGEVKFRSYKVNFLSTHIAFVPCNWPSLPEIQIFKIWPWKYRQIWILQMWHLFKNNKMKTKYVVFHTFIDRDCVKQHFYNPFHKKSQIRFFQPKSTHWGAVLGLKVRAHGHTVGPTSYQFISLSFQVQLLQNLNSKTQGQGHGWGESQGHTIKPSFHFMYFVFGSHQSAKPLLWYDQKCFTAKKILEKHLWNKRPVGLSSVVNCPPVVASFLTQRQLSVNARWHHMGQVRSIWVTFIEPYLI